MPREVTVACENPRAAAKAERGKRVFDTAVKAALRKAGMAEKTADWVYIETLRKTGVDPRTAAALAIQKPHAHAVVGIATEDRGSAEEDRSALGHELGGCGCANCEAKRALSPTTPAPTAGDSGFSKVVKDEAKFKALLARAQQVGPLDNDAGMYRFIRADLEKQDQEIFYVVGLDAHNGLRMVSEIARGQRDRVAVDVADVLRVVLMEGCKAFVVAHNHPAGDARPSAKDRELTVQLEKAAPAVGVIFLDHLVIGSASYYSFADKKLKRAG
jgi:DNA repair protein RadC